MQAKRRFGQVFLTNPHYIRTLLDAVPASPQGLFIEIGPGTGAMTGGLAEKCAGLIAVEIDREACAHLRERFGENGKITLLNQDFLAADLVSLAKGRTGITVVGNLPYNVASLILLRLVRHCGLIGSAYCMVQREVGDRIVSPPDCKAYSFLTVALATFCVVKRLVLLPPGAFSPAPKVSSAFLRLDFNPAPPVAPHEIDAYLRLVDRAFSRRRKKVINVLAESYPRGRLEAFFTANRLDPNARAENLTVAHFTGLFRSLNREEDG